MFSIASVLGEEFKTCQRKLRSFGCAMLVTFVKDGKDEGK
jgi:hypothetical protein